MMWTPYRCDTTETLIRRRESTRVDDEMLKELDVLEPKSIREKIDRETFMIDYR